MFFVGLEQTDLPITICVVIILFEYNVQFKKEYFLMQYSNYIILVYIYLNKKIHINYNENTCL